MSFSNEVRQEIYSTINDNDKKFACLYGMLIYCKSISRENITLQTESSVTARLCNELVKAVFKDKIHISVHESVKKNDNKLYTCTITDKNEIDIVLKRYFIDVENRFINQEIVVNNSLGVFTAGVFLSCGSLNDPSKEYHLEFAAPCRRLAEELQLILLDIGVNAKIFVRKNMYVVYIKESESIEDTLTYIGAQQCTIELMNVKIFKDVRNKANRLANCDSANIDKVVNAALKQIDNIKIIAETVGLNSLTPELREVAELRLENTDMSLQEIGNSLKTPISRSGINHRFKKLEKIANEIREEMVQKNEKQ